MTSKKRKAVNRSPDRNTPFAELRSVISIRLLQPDREDA